jgi:hypothetical protein
MALELRLLDSEALVPLEILFDCESRRGLVAGTDLWRSEVDLVDEDFSSMARERDFLDRESIAGLRRKGAYEPSIAYIVA